jgi:RecA-family ATPase
VSSETVSSDGDEEAVNPLRASRRTLFELWQYPDPSPLVADTLMLDSLALVWGKPGAKKSFTALDLSLCVATGNWWHGKETRKGTVLYFVGEGLSGIKQRTKAWMLHHKLTQEPEGWFSYGRAFDLLSRDAVSWAIEEAADLNPSLIVLDTLHRHSLGANENDSRDVGKMVESLDTLRATTGACVLTIHHSNKGGDDERGHSSLLGAVDTSIKVTSDEIKTELAWKKMKDGPTPDPRTFYTLPVEHTGSIVLDDQYHGTADVLEPAIRSVSAVLDECRATGLNVEMLAHEAGLSEGQVARALTRMLDDGDVKKVGYRWFPN